MKHGQRSKKSLRSAKLETLGDADLQAVVGGGSKSGGSKPIEHLTFNFTSVSVSYVSFDSK